MLLLIGILTSTWAKSGDFAQHAGSIPYAITVFPVSVLIYSYKSDDAFVIKPAKPSGLRELGESLDDNATFNRIDNKGATKTFKIPNFTSEKYLKVEINE